jgi:Ran GTPase-activating protein (RanGAP) involved in mRNA processing and transport
VRRLTSLSPHLWSKIGQIDLQKTTSVDLCGKGLRATEMDAIALELSENTQLQRLDLTANGFGGDGAPAVSQIVRSCPTLEVLALGNNNLRAGVVTLAEALATHERLRVLHIQANVVGPSSVKTLATAIASAPGLEDLDLSSNAFGPVGGVAIAEALASSASASSLERLDLTACAVGMRGAVAIAQALSGEGVAHRLRSIEMTTNFIGPDGLSAFATMLMGNTTLEELSLSDNAIGELGDRDTGTCGQALAAALEMNQSLRVLDLTFNNLSAAATQALVAASARRAVPLELKF